MAMGVGEIGKPKNTKLTIKELAFYYRNYKKMFIVAIVLALIGGIASVFGILFNGIIYSQYIIPSMFIKMPPVLAPTDWTPNYALFGLVTFI
jgi:ABC-type multidrug transport system fused ATPase/permease subunit